MAGRTCTGEDGFTFVEVLVAAALVGLIVAAAGETALLSQRLHRRARAVHGGLHLAESRLERLTALGWEEGTEDCEPEAFPSLLGDGEVHSALRAERDGWRYLVVAERRPAGDRLDYCRVWVFWRSPGGVFERGESLSLETRMAEI